MYDKDTKFVEKVGESKNMIKSVMDEILNILPTLLGFIFGGCTTYIIEIIKDKRRDRHQLVLAYNKILFYEKSSSPLKDYSDQHETSLPFVWDKYYEGIRKHLYDNLHLFHNKVIYNVLEIDYIGNQIYDDSYYHGAFEDISYTPSKEARKLYCEIINEIKKDYRKKIN